MVTLIILANVFVFVAMALGIGKGNWSALELMQWGGNYAVLSLRGDWWRLIAAAFLHINIVHIVVNMGVLASAGRSVRSQTGPAMFLLAYIACGVAGNVASAWYHPFLVSVGASGAVAGMVGMLVVFQAGGHCPDVGGRWLAWLVGLNAALCLVPGDDWVAHLCGLVTGLGIGAVLLAPAAAGLTLEVPAAAMEAFGADELTTDARTAPAMAAE